MQIAPAGIPEPDWGPEMVVNTSQGNALYECSGVRFRNAIAGQVATVSGYLAQPNDPIWNLTGAGGAGTTPPPSNTVGFARVTALPASPVDGNTIEYVDAASGSDWFFQYNSTTGLWVWVGGENYAEVLTDENTSTLNTYIDLTTVGPSITVPLAGDYLIRAGSKGWSTVNTGQAMATAIEVGAAATVDADAFGNTGATSALMAIGANRAYRKTLTAGTALKLQYKTPSAVAHWLARWLTVHPITVHP